MSKAEWTRTAQADLARLDDYYVAFSPAYADKLGQAALAAANFLAEHRSAGSPIQLGTRKWRLRDLDFVLIYREVAGGVEILRLRHGREDWREPLE